MKIKNMIAACTVALGTIGGVSLGVPQSDASAHGNACTNAPDSGPGWDFHDACHTHDSCYAEKPYGNSQWGRLQCDSDFHANMYDSCDAAHGWYNPARYACYEVADTYFSVVVAAGWYYWD